MPLTLYRQVAFYVETSPLKKFLAGFMPLLLTAVLSIFNVFASDTLLDNSIGVALTAALVLPGIQQDGKREPLLDRHA